MKEAVAGGIGGGVGGSAAGAIGGAAIGTILKGSAGAATGAITGAIIGVTVGAVWGSLVGYSKGGETGGAAGGKAGGIFGTVIGGAACEGVCALRRAENALDTFLHVFSVLGAINTIPIIVNAAQKGFQYSKVVFETVMNVVCDTGEKLGRSVAERCMQRQLDE